MKKTYSIEGEYIDEPQALKLVVSFTIFELAIIHATKTFLIIIGAFGMIEYESADAILEKVLVWATSRNPILGIL